MNEKTIRTQFRVSHQEAEELVAGTVLYAHKKGVRPDSVGAFLLALARDEPDALEAKRKTREIFEKE